ncbi:uncharacterized protein LOC129576316 [Sitodiplosis mosellana]|uniref:uncharacterized protein LOC129576316 n=1 Tax=Sitodiplosis mosellana TaxID=263140 RepID=UPI002444C18C|nr:uncharacterized protein LOC129576316 [Sitodiplosis mosellana]XP_055317209.1 uncharacterized protein LOC129576316 [Sitodiplosis mosellana]
MDQSVIRKVKLTSLRIVDFKKLQKGLLSWNIQPVGTFGVISVKDFYERTTLFQAFQFGFGHDTDAQKAEVIVTLQRGNGVGQVETWHFKHSKKVVHGVAQMAYGIQIDGVDDAFRAVEQKEYFNQFAELKVCALTQPFCFGGGIKNALATSHIDLRPFLEMYLMGKEQNNDYDEFDGSVEMLSDQKKVLSACNKKIKQTQEAFNKQVEKEKCETDGKRDLWLLQLFFYHTYAAVLRDEIFSLRQQIDNGNDLQGVELRRRILQRDDDFTANGLVELAKMDWKSRLDAQRKTIQDKIEEEARVLSMTNINAAKQFGEAYAQFEHDNLDLIIKSEDERFDLLLAEYGKVGTDWKTNDGNGNSPWCKQLEDAKNEAAAKLQRAKLSDAEIYQYKGAGFTLNHYTRLPPSDGFCTVETTDFDPKNLRDEWDNEPLNEHVIVHITRGYEHLEPNPFGRLISRDDSVTNFDVLQSLSSLMLVQNSIEQKDYSELGETVKRIKEKGYSGIWYRKDDAETATMDQEKHDLENKVKETEHELAAKYSAEFKNIWSDLGFGTDTTEILSGIDCIKRHQDVFATSQQAVQQQIDLSEQKVAELKSYQQRLDTDESLRLDFHEQMTLEMFIEAGKKIDESHELFVKHACIDSLLLLKEEFLDGATLAIEHINIVISKLVLDLPFDPTKETSPKAYFDQISPRNACTFGGDASIDEIFKTVASQISKIELEIGHKDGHIFHNDPELNALAKKNKRVKRTINSKLVVEKRQVAARADAFEKRFLHFVKVFSEMSLYCHSKWNMTLTLSYEEPALKSPITMLVTDPMIGFDPKQITTLSHHAAALVLKLAINQAIGSPILIIDSLDYIIKPALIGPIMKLLQNMTTSHEIQVISMMVNPQEELTATTTHHMWINKTDTEEIVETTDLVVVNIDGTRAAYDEASAASNQPSMEWQ